MILSQAQRNELEDIIIDNTEAEHDEDGYAIFVSKEGIQEIIDFFVALQWESLNDVRLAFRKQFANMGSTERKSLSERAVEDIFFHLAEEKPTKSNGQK